MSQPAKEWAAIAGAFSDGQTFTVVEAAEVIRPHVNPMVALRKSQIGRKTEGRATSWETYETRRLDDVTAGLRIIARMVIYNRLGRNGCRPLVERVGDGRYRLTERQVAV